MTRSDIAQKVYEMWQQSEVDWHNMPIDSQPPVTYIAEVICEAAEKTRDAALLLKNTGDILCDEFVSRNTDGSEAAEQTVEDNCKYWRAKAAVLVPDLLQLVSDEREAAEKELDRVSLAWGKWVHSLLFRNGFVSVDWRDLKLSVVRKYVELGAMAANDPKPGAESVAWQTVIAHLTTEFGMKPNDDAPEFTLDLLEKLPPNETGMVTHTFWLRPDLRVSIDLPADLTKQEAERIARMLKTLPVEQ